MADVLIIDFECEPRGDIYRSLLEIGLETCDRCLFVVRERSWLDEAGRRLLASLEPHLKDHVSRAEWPGTVLSTGQAEVLTYEYGPEVLEWLLEPVDGLYGWVAPLPEDLCLLRGHEPWLVSVAHERDAYIRVGHEVEDRSLLGTRPELWRHLRLRAGRSADV